MFDDLIPVFGGLLNKLANTDEGHKLVDDLGSVIGRFYKNLTEVQGLPPESAAVICGAMGKGHGATK